MRDPSDPTEHAVTPRIHNPNCDGSHCQSETGEVRVLPLGGGANLILCVACHAHEIAWRRERNRELSKDAAYALPAWAELEVYVSS
jgi:hypothetical protein